MMSKPIMTPEEARKDHEQMLRFMAKRFALGLIIGLTCATLIFIFDIGHLGTHLLRASNPIIPIFLLAVPMGLTTGAIVLCIAIWTLPYEAKYEKQQGRDPF
jgi:flagellar biosynthesis protein FliR